MTDSRGKLRFLTPLSALPLLCASALAGSGRRGASSTVFVTERLLGSVTAFGRYIYGGELAYALTTVLLPARSTLIESPHANAILEPKS